MHDCFHNYVDVREKAQKRPAGPNILSVTSESAVHSCLHTVYLCIIFLLAYVLQWNVSPIMTVSARIS